jgi:hypothetical protein
VVFNVLAALPTAGEPSLERMQRPFEREELTRWVGLLRAVGVDTDAERLARGYVAFSAWMERARAVALSPIDDFMALTLTHQGWRLFGTPDRNVSALRVTTHSAAGDEVLYESGNPDRRWHAAFLEYRRIRADYNPSRRGPPATYAAFAKRLSDEIFATSPDIRGVTVALVEMRVQLPHEIGRTPEAPAEARHVLEFARPSS